ncbi:hypothetical protein MMC22_010020, partial [Lobaria immixta]|nr:hypothetical protein [Lobaria immixta]
MNSTNSRDWQAWLAITQVAFASVLKANITKKCLPKNQQFIDTCQFPLGDDEAAINSLVLDNFLLCVSQEQTGAFLAKYGRLADDWMLEPTELKSQTDSDFDSNLDV